MKNFCSINAKYYKTTKAAGVLGHVNRQFSDNKNALPKELLKYENFKSSENLNEIFNEKLKKAEDSKGKKFQKNANTLIDCVLVFSEDQFNENLKYGYSTMKVAMTKRIESFQAEIKEKYGLEPVGFEFHLDEGTLNPDGTLKSLNPHAHLSFLNYDFKTKTSPLRKMKRNDFSNMQDILANHFKDMDYKRGEKKKTTAKHLEKDEYIKEKQKILADELLKTENLLMALKANIRGFVGNLRKYIVSTIHAEKTAYIHAESVKNDIFDEHDKSLKEIMEKVSFETDKELKSDVLTNKIKGKKPQRP